MINKHEIVISDESYAKLKKLSELLKTDVDFLIQIAFNEFFELIRDDPMIFLEQVGLISRLKSEI